MKKISWSRKLFTIISSLGIVLLLSSLTSAVFFSFSSYPPRLIKNTKQPPKPLVLQRDAQLQLCRGESFFGYKLWGVVTKDKKYCAIPEIYPWYPYSSAWFDFDQNVANLVGINKELFYLYSINKGLVELEINDIENISRDLLDFLNKNMEQKLEEQKEQQMEKFDKNLTTLEGMDKKIREIIDYNQRVEQTKIVSEILFKIMESEKPINLEKELLAAFKGKV